MKEPLGRGKWASALRAATPTPSRDYSQRLSLHQSSRSVSSSFSLLSLGIVSM